jgi:hypothetical protein
VYGLAERRKWLCLVGVVFAGYMSCQHVPQVVGCSFELVWRLECDGFVGEAGGDSLVELIQGCQNCYVGGHFACSVSGLLCRGPFCLWRVKKRARGLHNEEESAVAIFSVCV